MESEYNRMFPEMGVKISEWDIAGVYSSIAQFPKAILLTQETVDFLGNDAVCLDMITYRLTFITICEQAAGLPSAARCERLEKIIKFFHEEGTKKHRFDWGEHRAKAILAEDYYIDDKKDKADKIFAELRSEVPKFPEDPLAGWVLFVCDRHDARRAYEKGEYEKALSYIKEAETGCFRFGHRGASKPLAMQQICELKAKILRKLGKDQEAEWAEGDARRIAKNLAKCREAVAKIPLRIPRVTKRPDGTLHFDFENPIIIPKGETAGKEKNWPDRG